MVISSSVVKFFKKVSNGLGGCRRVWNFGEIGVSMKDVYPYMKTIYYIKMKIIVFELSIIDNYKHV